MKSYKPRVPDMTVKEIEECNPMAYKIVMEVVRRSALCMYHSGPAPRAMGLEMCMEAIIELIDTGYAKILYVRSEDEPGEDIMYVGFFYESTGEYRPPVYAIFPEDNEGEEWKNV